ncbi:PPE family protein [Mycobacterium angelicum]|uniref:PPE family protein n=1 Tax=Mycobacterium angelicum TaxID=470074 RepID=A0A1W9ZY44_MYCAN|nr:PPE family protein [Mycobacterium angelicum]MCV7198062.1 PPE family protein [Mycobacterium angelicum]ORA22690.1 hypothetical protein BST12_08930 [Mycobacterium angelicum]
MDFGALPPEVNSACMYAGAGAAPLLAAASAWNGVAAELSRAASSFESVIAGLASEHWMGPAALSMTAAAQPLVVWLTCTAESSAVAAAQAMASAAAFETAFAMTVPPAEIAANRARLAQLIATDVLGENVTAISVTEARYGEMWAQDASVMYGYAASSAVAGRLNPLTRPPQLNAASGSAQEVGFGELIARAPDVVMSLASPVASAPDAAALDAVRLFSGLDASDIPLLEGVNHNKAMWADFGTGFMGLAAPAKDDAEGTASSTAAGAAAVPPIGRTPAVASLGNASSVGYLSVPAIWYSAAPTTVADNASLDGTGWTVPEADESIPAIPPAPAMVPPGNGVGAGPRYGVKPTVMPKQGLF